MTWSSPNYYMSPRELANLVVQSLENQGYFKPDELAHPEDLVIAFTSTADSIAIGAGHIVRKVWENDNTTNR